MHLEEAMGELREHFGLQPEDLNVDLGPLGALLAPPDHEPSPDAEKSQERDQ